jgi:hypothetical protein
LWSEVIGWAFETDRNKNFGFQCTLVLGRTFGLPERKGLERLLLSPLSFVLYLRTVNWCFGHVKRFRIVQLLLDDRSP